MRKVEINIKIIQKLLVITLVIIGSSYLSSYSQGVNIFVEKNKIALNEDLKVSIIFPKEYKKEFKAYHNYFFPDITDFIKGRTLYLEETDPRQYKITQYYSPRKTGSFSINPIRIATKEEVFQSERLKVYVSKKKINLKEEQPREIKEDLEFTEEAPEAFLNFTSSRKAVYVGEGFGATLSFYIAASNKSEITFIDLVEQRNNLLKKIKSGKFLTEDFNLEENVKVDTVRVNGKLYTKWKLYEGVFYPLDSNNIIFPALDFKVITYKTAKNGNISMERKAIYQNFHSKQVFIQVKALPKYAHKGYVPVGNFRLSEDIYPDKFRTGKSIKYLFIVVGEGNIASIREPYVIQTEYFDIYTPKISQEIMKQDERIMGAKSFTYYITPKEPGRFNLKDYIKWVYFNTITQKYDTLSSNFVLEVKGESLKNNYISTNNPGDFYNRIFTDSNTLRSVVKDDRMKFYANIAILFMLLITAIIVLKK